MSDEEPMGRSPEQTSVCEPEGQTAKSGAQVPERQQRTAPSKKIKQHRFDHFAKKMAASMLEAISATLLVFSAPDKERWPTSKLLDYLKSAEALARDMLREIAQKIFIYPAPVRERMSSCETQTAPSPSGDGAPYFRLAVNETVDERRGEVSLTQDDNCDTHEPRPTANTSNATAQRPGEAGIAASIYEKRLTALEDVLAHPRKHAARMARALFREDEGPGQRLIARSQNDLLLDHINFILDDPAYAKSEAAFYMHCLVMDPG